MNKQTPLRAEHASRVRLFLYQLGIFLLVFLIMLPLTLYFFSASPIVIPISTVLVLLTALWLSKRLLGSTDSDRPYESTAQPDQ